MSTVSVRLGVEKASVVRSREVSLIQRSVSGHFNGQLFGIVDGF